MKKKPDKLFKKELVRKLLHLSSLWIPLFIYFFPRPLCICLFGFAIIANTTLEYGNYKKWPFIRKTFGSIFYKTMRRKEINRRKFVISGSVYVFIASFACSILFHPEIAALSLTVMLISDSCSALFGKAFGRRKIYKDKSLEGTTAFFVSAIFLMIIFSPIVSFGIKSIFACFGGTIVEMYEDKLKIDDNLSIPLIVGLTLTLL